MSKSEGLNSMADKYLEQYERMQRSYDRFREIKSRLNPKLKRFLIRSHRRFEDADKTRNRCAHVNEGEPTRQEIEQSISLARLLQRFR